MTPEAPFTDAEREAAAEEISTIRHRVDGEQHNGWHTLASGRETFIYGDHLLAQMLFNRAYSALQATLAREAATQVRHDAKLEELELALHLAVTERGERMSSGTYIGNARSIIAKGGTTRG